MELKVTVSIAPMDVEVKFDEGDGIRVVDRTRFNACPWRIAVFDVSVIESVGVTFASVTCVIDCSPLALV